MTSFDNLSQNVLGLVALLVSAVALLTTVLQVLQQYFSSAEGYRRCHESVMGGWYTGTHRKLRMREFRFEVVFETPVIFTAPPENKRGPIPNKQIHYINGTDKSRSETRVPTPEAHEQAVREASQRVHTADDERASWLTLLTALEDNEATSREWEERERTKAPPRGKGIERPRYSLAVGIQAKTRSWDFIPSSITRPYATSAICHLVEVMAMLGVYWKSFDQSIWNLRAEGNGFILTSTTVHGLGVMVSFAVTGRSKFTDNRVIPTHEIKELAFGTVPNIFDEKEAYMARAETQSLELVFGTDDDVTNTLESIGCQAKTLYLYKKDHKHIFSVSFEIIGMLGQVFRLRGSNFRMLPNPTGDSWPKQKGKKAAWKIARLMEVFQQRVQELINNEDLGLSEKNPITKIAKRWEAISALGCTDEATLKIETREAIHDSIDCTTDYLLGLTQVKVLDVVRVHISKVLEVLANPVSELNTIIRANKEDPFIGYYFDTIRLCVIEDLDPPSAVKIEGTEPYIEKPAKKEKFSKETIKERNEIWISLIFRMLCWLLLHDFDKGDTNIIPSDLKGSRMPVFIG